MRNVIRRRGAPLGLALLTISLALVEVAETQTPSGPAPDAVVTVGTIVPNASGYKVQLDQEQVAKVYPRFVAALPPPHNGRVAPLRVEDFTASVQKQALEKLSTLFPNGIPAPIGARIKIRIGVTLSRPPEISVTITF